ncbi:hypothetical protein [Motiliproteus sp. SC1-56]|uniref:hypothetical protein n=1 Tax=Motiliproteus sp. SC1-56 TaxID=2799565 RepID=UPI001A8DAC2B|nr:hypothetical protein [Motiliproteus sp. SC1-56]
MKRPFSLGVHLSSGSLLYALAGGADTWLTLLGTAPSLALEANPLLRQSMQVLGPLNGILVVKGAVLIAVVIFAVAVYRSIDRGAAWVYYLAVFPLSRRWMHAAPRHWLSVVPLYAVALAQAAAALLWWRLLQPGLA